MSEYVSKLDVCIAQQQMPMTVKAFCKVCHGDKCIVVNQDLNDEKKLEAVAHELRHFAKDDLNSDEPVEVIENRE